MIKKTYKIRGMHCVSCVKTIEDVLMKTKGVHLASVNFASESALIEYDENVISDSVLVKAVDSIGYHLDAGIDKTDIDYINGHGTSTRKGDQVEVDSLKELFGSYLEKIPISSNKSQLGHSLGATAAIEAVLTLYGMKQRTILPTINYLPDPEMGKLNFVPDRPIEQEFSIALSNSFGFGGTNCCVLFKAPDPSWTA